MTDGGWHRVTTGVAIYWIYKLVLVFVGLVYVAVTRREPILCLIIGNLAAFTIVDVTDAMVMSGRERAKTATRTARFDSTQG